jgi:hypothetical protein
VKVANSCCQGRIVSSLEGGYQIPGEYSSAFAKSVKIHVNALMRGAKCPSKYDQDEMQRELQLEENVIRDGEAKRLAKIDAQNRRREEAMAQRRVEYEAAVAADNKDADQPVAEIEASPNKKRGRKQVDYQELARQMEEELRNNK